MKGEISEAKMSEAKMGEAKMGEAKMSKAKMGAGGKPIKAPGIDFDDFFNPDASGVKIVGYYSEDGIDFDLFRNSDASC